VFGKNDTFVLRSWPRVESVDTQHLIDRGRSGRNFNQAWAESPGVPDERADRVLNFPPRRLLGGAFFCGKTRTIILVGEIR